MRALMIELQKEKRTGVLPVLPAVGMLGAAYAFISFLVRKDALLNLPLRPMDVLLTQLYGMMMTLNLFGIVAAACMVYNMEFQGGAVKKMYMLPMSVPGMYLCKFLNLTVMLFAAMAPENLALMQIGMKDLPEGAFEMGTLLRFTAYSFLTSMPVLSFMVLISSRFENMWVPLGAGVAGFLSGMALAPSAAAGLMAHPFICLAAMWAITVLFEKPLFSVGLNLLLVIPGILAANTPLWIAYPYCYSGYLVSCSLHDFTAEASSAAFSLMPFLPCAAAVFAALLTLSLTQFGKRERR